MFASQAYGPGSIPEFRIKMYEIFCLHLILSLFSTLAKKDNLHFFGFAIICALNSADQSYNLLVIKV